MKKIIILCFALFATAAIAHTIDWYVDGQIYQTTSCESGDSITPPTPPAKYGYTFREWQSFSWIEYIESTGTQWIDTGFIANGGMILDAKAMPVDGEMYIGSVDDSGIATLAAYSRNLISYTGGRYYPQKMDNYEVSYTNAGTTPAVIHIDTTRTKFYCTIDGNLVVDTTTGVLQNQTTTVKLSFSDYSQSVKKGRYYYVQIKDSTGTLVRDFVPAKRNSDNVVGMYDTVSRTFFTNQGTGDFVAGPTLEGGE